MIKLERSSNNPILSPNPNHAWESAGAFNGCVVEVDGIYHMVYRALSDEKRQNGVNMRVSTVGYATSTDGVHFGEHHMLFEPTEDWEVYGCEDPRITYLDGKFYIFYTALSVYPFAAYGIKTARENNIWYQTNFFILCLWFKKRVISSSYDMIRIFIIQKHCADFVDISWVTNSMIQKQPSVFCFYRWGGNAEFDIVPHVGSGLCNDFSGETFVLAEIKITRDINPNIMT